MSVPRLLAFVGIAVILVGTLLAAVVVPGPSHRVPVAGTAAKIPVWNRLVPRGGHSLESARRSVARTPVPGSLPMANVYPTGIEYDGGKGEMFVADAASDNVTVISDVTNTLLANIRVGVNPFGLAYDGAMGEIFVANQASNDVSVISDATNSVVVASIPAGSGPQWEAYDSAKGEVFLANAFSNNVTVISDATNAVVASIQVGSYPAGVAYDSGKGEVFVANQASNNVTVISDVTNSVVADIAVGSYPTGVAYDAGKGEVFVSNLLSNNVSVISDAMNSVVATIDVGTSPFGAAYDSARGEVFVVNSNSNNVSVISDTTDSVVATIPIGPIPSMYSVAFTETGLPTGTSWSVTVNGTAQSSTSGTITFSEPNGTYAYTVGSVSGYIASPSSGSVTVTGADVGTSIAFTQVTYSVMFAETGLSTGTSWSVTLASVSHSSATTSVMFSEPNGTYMYTVGSPTGYRANPPSGTIPVNGQDVSKAITFSAISAGPTISAFTVSASTITLGSSVTFATTATGGTAPLTYGYAGLPSGCSSVNASTLTCTPMATGSFSVTVTVTDSVGRSATATVPLIVNAQSEGSPSGSTILGLPTLEAYAILAAIVIIVGGVVAIFWSRRRRMRQPPSPPLS